jgi:hypothetical protein
VYLNLTTALLSVLRNSKQQKGEPDYLQPVFEDPSIWKWAVHHNSTEKDFCSTQPKNDIL